MGGTPSCLCKDGGYPRVPPSLHRIGCPHPDLGRGTPILTWMGVGYPILLTGVPHSTPILTWDGGIPPSWPSKGVPPSWPEMGYPLCPDLGSGYPLPHILTWNRVPTCPDLRWGNPPYMCKQTDRQTRVKTLPSPILRMRAVKIQSQCYCLLKGKESFVLICNFLCTHATYTGFISIRTW